MNEHISILQGYIDHLEYMKKNADDFFDREQADKDVEAFKAAIKALEQEPKTGHWIDNGICYECSECGIIRAKGKTGKYNYCPSCGCAMVEPQETETWNSPRGQITAPKGTFEKILNDTDEDDNDRFYEDVGRAMVDDPVW